MNVQSIYNLTPQSRNFVERTIIDLAGIQSGMLRENFVTVAKQLSKFKQPANGLPVLIPFIPEIFDSSQKFEIKSSVIKNLIYGSVEENYIGYKLSFNNSTFATNFVLKDDFREKVMSYTEDLLFARRRIQDLVKEFTSVGAFQTRNVPHLGHERIIDEMLNHCELVVINPMVGPKKIGDIDSEKLKGIYDSVLRPRYQNKITFIPIRANMFYAGPREAIHHARIRRWLGFTHFSVGRDHAGAEGIYNESAATDMTKQCQNNLSIKIITHGGAFFCRLCDKVVLKNHCNHSKDTLTEISGSDFRHCLNMKKTYPFAALDVQQWASKNLKSLQT